MSEPVVPFEPLLSPKECAARLGISPGRICQLIADGKVPHYDFGPRSRRVRLSEVVAATHTNAEKCSPKREEERAAPAVAEARQPVRLGLRERTPTAFGAPNLRRKSRS
jgi:excisionase family DNA binding protein